MTSREGSTRGFWALIVTQFQGAFSDNALKALVTFLGLALAATHAERERVVPLVGLLFSLPFIFFSMAGGWLADRLSKRAVSLGVKIFELGIMAFAWFGLRHEHLPMAFAAVALMGVHSAFFGPSKYGLLPELLPEHRLSWGNGILELGTFLAIILGGAAGGLLYQQFKGRYEHAALLLLAFAGIGLAAALAITRVPAVNPGKAFRANFLGDLFSQIGRIRRDRILWLAVLGNTYFFYLGALILQNAILFGADTLRVDEFRTSCLQAALAVGIGLGSFAAGCLSGGKIEYGLVPLGAIGMTIFSGALGVPILGYRAALLLLTLLGFFGGFFIVPICAIMQHRPDRKERGAVLAAANLLSFVGIALASGVFWLLRAADLTTSQVFLAGAGMTLAVLLLLSVLLPDAFLRMLLWGYTHSLVRLRVEGGEHLSAAKGALLVAERSTFADGLLILAATDHPLRPIMARRLYDRPWIRLFAKSARALPCAPRALREAGVALREGEAVLVWRETGAAVDGEPSAWERRLGRLLENSDVARIAVQIDAPSDQTGRRRLLFRARTVRFGRPTPRPHASDRGVVHTRG